MKKSFFLKSEVNSENVLKGNIEGIAYTGEPIPYFYGFENFIIDLESLRFAKKKVPLLRDHMTELVAGHSSVDLIDEGLSLKGVISKKTATGAEIIALSEDGFEWELSVGIYEGDVEENFSGIVNGREVENATVLRDGLLREVSIVALGADRHTSAKIFKQPSEEKAKMKKVIKFLGLSEDAKESEVIAKLEQTKEEAEEAIKEKEETIENLEKVIDDLEETVEKLTEEIEEIKEEQEIEEREEEINAIVSEKGMTLSSEEVKKIAASKETAELFKSTIAALQVRSKIDPKFTKKTEFRGEESNKKTLREQALTLVKEGKYKNYMDAILAVSEE